VGLARVPVPAATSAPAPATPVSFAFAFAVGTTVVPLAGDAVRVDMRFRGGTVR